MAAANESAAAAGGTDGDVNRGSGGGRDGGGGGSKLPGVVVRQRGGGNNGATTTTAPNMELHTGAYGSATAGVEMNAPLCGLCHEEIEDGVVAACGHGFCRTCVMDYVEGAVRVVSEGLVEGFF